MKIKIPIGLAEHYANHKPMIRIMATYCRLKALESSSCISNWRKHLEELAEFCRCSNRTLETRVSEMKTLGLVKMENGKLILMSWDNLWQITNIPHKNKRYWYYDNDKVNCRLEYLLQFLAIREIQKKAERAYHTRVKNIPGYVSEIKYILGIGHDQSITMQDHLAGIIDSFAEDGYSPDDMYMLNAVNPDNQLSCKRLQKLYGFSDKSVSGPSYRKKILIKHKLITVEKRSVESSIRSRNCIVGTVNYSRKSKRTFLRLCDVISPSL